VVLLTISLSLGRALAWAALAIIILAGGLAVWALAAPGTVHLGASGVIFGLTGFLLFSGILRRDWKSLVASLAVLLLYGGIFFSLLVVRPGVSWSSHFFGFLAGILAAWILKPRADKTQREKARPLS
jgi:membrane associated rhomboid family serine protease